MSENAVEQGSVLDSIEPETLRKEVDELKADIRRDLGAQIGPHSDEENYEQEEEAEEQLEFDYDPGELSEDEAHDGTLGQADGSQSAETKEVREETAIDKVFVGDEQEGVQAAEAKPVVESPGDELDDATKSPEQATPEVFEPLDDPAHDGTHESPGYKAEDEEQEPDSSASGDSGADFEGFSEYLSIPVQVNYDGGKVPLYDPEVGESILSHPATAEFSLDSVFHAIREHFETSTGFEIILHVPQLDLEVGEDNLYCNDTTLLDLLRLLDTCGEAENLQLSVELRPRFISKLNDLFDKLNDLPPAKKSRLV